MRRQPLPLAVPDAMQFARTLGQTLHARHTAGQAPPGHVALLNLMARALGHRNLQSLQAAAVYTLPAAASQACALPDGPSPPSPASLPTPVLATEDRPPPEPLSDNARKALMQFDSRGRLIRWPHKFSVQRLAMWVLWTLFDGRRSYTEREVNEVLKAAHCFGDHATLRRELINHRLMSRKPDCSDYRKLPAQPDAEARGLLQAWRAQRQAHQQPRVERPDSPRLRHQQRLADAALAAAGPSTAAG